MNHVLHDIASTASGGLLMGVMTLFFLLFFGAWTWWAWSPRNRALMHESASMPLDEGDR